MIVVQVTDPQLRRAVARAASLEEDVIGDDRLARDALEWGYPRLVVREGSYLRQPLPSRFNVFEIDPETMRRWDVARRAEELPLTRVDYAARRVAIAMAGTPLEGSGVDRALAELTRSTGQRLPLPLRSFSRRVLEFPYHYRTLHALAETCGTTRGALKAKFRRRGMASPATYLRWLRLMAAADVLSDASVTVAGAAQRLGFTSDGNMCRTMWSTARMTPTDLRSVNGRKRLLLTFAWGHLGPGALEGWAALDDLFERKVA